MAFSFEMAKLRGLTYLAPREFAQEKPGECERQYSDFDQEGSHEFSLRHGYPPLPVVRLQEFDGMLTLRPHFHNHPYFMIS